MARIPATHIMASLIFEMIRSNVFIGLIPLPWLFRAGFAPLTLPATSLPIF
jgi:hypothetical protein